MITFIMIVIINIIIVIVVVIVIVIVTVIVIVSVIITIIISMSVSSPVRRQCLASRRFQQRYQVPPSLASQRPSPGVGPAAPPPRGLNSEPPRNCPT